jgi:hypothetical protein
LPKQPPDGERAISQFAAPVGVAGPSARGVILGFDLRYCGVVAGRRRGPIEGEGAAGAVWRGAAPVDRRNGGRSHCANHCDGYMPWMHSLVTTIYIDKLSMTDQLNSGATESEKEREFQRHRCLEIPHARFNTSHPYINRPSWHHNSQIYIISSWSLTKFSTNYCTSSSNLLRCPKNITSENKNFRIKPIGQVFNS